MSSRSRECESKNARGINGCSAVLRKLGLSKRVRVKVSLLLHFPHSLTLTNQWINQSTLSVLSSPGPRPATCPSTLGTTTAAVTKLATTSTIAHVESTTSRAEEETPVSKETTTKMLRGTRKSAASYHSKKKRRRQGFNTWKRRRIASAITIPRP